MKKILTMMVCASMAASAMAAGTEVFSWKDSTGATMYSDTPAQLQLDRASIVNIRTGTVTPPTPKAVPMENLSVAEQQAIVNQRIAEQNKQTEEANAKLAAETKEQNCKSARMNLDTVQKTNPRNKDQLIPRYNADIAKYCS